jgi:POT family proton-dependent oligopeptide transporter
MAQKTPWRTIPDHENPGWPPGIPFIIGNEGCERFSFYGMKAILYVYLAYLYVQSGMAEKQAEDSATAIVHTFVAGVYALPMVGAILADRLLGKYDTILWLSILYTGGHGMLAISEGQLTGTYIGLAMIAIGSGGIKPCVSANVGDQFGKANWHRLERVYQAFYFIINFGSFFSTLLIPWLKKEYGFGVAFGVPGVLMAIATVFFWAGRHKFVHVPPKPGGLLGLLDALAGALMFMTIGSLMFTAEQPWAVKGLVSATCLVIGLAVFFYRQTRTPDDGFLAVSIAMLRNAGAGAWSRAEQRFGAEAVEGTRAVYRILGIFLFVSVFWALFDQHASSWIRQAAMMELELDLPLFGHITLMPEQISAANPAMVMGLIPFVTFVMYPGLGKLGLEMTPLRRMTLGMGIASLAFVTVALLQARIDGGTKVHVAWQLIPYLLMTLAEVLVSITGLEFAYSQAPKRMKSTIMGFWLLTVSLGNVLVAVLAAFGDLPLVQFFWVFAGLMAVAAVLFGLIGRGYQTRDYPQ